MKKESGNALIYVLVSIILFGILTYLLAGADTDAPVSDRTKAVQAGQVTEILSYAGQIKGVYEQMLDTGTSLDTLDLTLPSAGAFNTAPTIYKLFHPDGGGLTYKDAATASYVDQTCAAALSEGWNFTKAVDWKWSKTTADDFFANLICVKAEVCAALNLQLTGSSTIPAFVGNIDNTFSASPTADFETTDCASCENHSSLCVSKGGNYVFYNLIASR